MRALLAAFTAIVSGSLFGLTLGDIVALDEKDVALLEKLSGEYRHKKLGPLLGQVAELSNNDEALQGNDILHEALFFKDNNKVMVEIVFLRYSDGSSLVSNMIENMGFEKETCNWNKCVGWAPANRLTSMVEDLTVNFMKEVPRPFTSTVEAIGTPDESINGVPDEGYRSMRADEVFAEFGLTGNGQTIGVISNSFNCLGDYDQDVQTRDLPPGVQILAEASDCSNVVGAPTATDEGRAMAQLIYDVAPSARMIFHAAFNAGPSGLADAVTNLGNAGSTIVTDDVAYLLQPFFQDDEITQAIDANAARGIPHFSSAGNSARSSWHTDTGFVDSGQTFEGAPLHDFGGGNIVQGINLAGGSSFRLVFQWDEPFASVPNSAGSASDVDVILLKPSGGGYISAFPNIGADAVEFIPFTTEGTTDEVLTYGIVIVLRSGPAPRYMKWIMYGSTSRIFSIQYDNKSSTCVNHSNAGNGAGVGAASYLDTPPFGVSPAVQESFSSAGGTPIFFDTAGSRLASPIVRNQPRFVGPDRTLTTFFVEPLQNRFPGTSASAPHVAALAALMKERASTLTPAQVYSILESTAEDMDDTATPGSDPGFDFGTGYGFVNGISAVRAVPAPDPTPRPTARPTTLSPTISPPITNYRVSLTFGFSHPLGQGPTDAENEGLERLTEIFYTRVIASLHALPYDDVNVEVKQTSTTTSTNESGDRGPPVATLEVDFEMVVSFSINPNLPTPETVRGNIENIDGDTYIQQFVQNAEPDNSLYREAESVLQIDAMIMRP